MFVAIAFIYNLNKKKVAEMTAELQARRVAEATENAVETEAVEAKAEAPEKEQKLLLDKLQAARAGTDVVLLGGVRFKYQPVRSGRSLEEDLRLGMERCDAIVVTGEGTGLATPQEKVQEFRRILGDFPLVVGAGVTIDTVEESLRVADGMIVGSYFKQGHKDSGDVEPAHVQAFMDKKRSMQLK